MELYTIFLMIYITFAIARAMQSYSHYNRLPDKSVAQLRREKIMRDFIEGHNRIIDDFVLTGAALPMGQGAIRPVEGYRVTDIESNGSVFFVVAAVSAEKIWNLLMSFIELLGDSLQMAILNINTDDGKPVDYISEEMDRYALVSTLQNHRDLIVNNGAVEICFFKADVKLEMRLDSCKHFQIFVADLVPVIDLLHDYGLSAKEDIRFFHEGPHFTIFPEDGQKDLKLLLDRLTIVQTNVYDNNGNAGS